jgi:Tfp pilus assembly protein PilF
VATSVNDLGEVLRVRGELDDAQAAFERALRSAEAAYGPDHPKVARVVHNLGLVLVERGEFDDAQAAYERALRIAEATLRPDHPAVATDVNSLAQVLLSSAIEKCRSTAARDAFCGGLRASPAGEERCWGALRGGSRSIWPGSAGIGTL